MKYKYEDKGYSVEEAAQLAIINEYENNRSKDLVRALWLQTCLMNSRPSISNIELMCKVNVLFSEE